MPFWAAAAPIIGSLLGGAASRGGDVNSSTSVQVPPWMQQQLQTSLGTSGGALSQLQQLLNGNTVAPFSDLQQQGIQQGTDLAGGAGGFLPASLQALLGSTQGQGLGGFLDPTALSALQGLAGGSQGGIPPGALNALSTIAGGQPTGQALGGVLGSSPFSDSDIESLRRTAAGDFVAGGPGYQQALDNARQQGTKAIASTFGRAGAGAATGGLAQQGLGQIVSDAALNFSNQALGRQQQASQTLAGLGLQGRQQNIAGAGALDSLALQGTGQQIGAANALGGLGLAGGQQQLNAANSLGGFGSTERGRQLQSATQLPGLANFGPQLLQLLGGQQQQQSQAELSGPINSLMQLLQASNSIPGAFAPLLGQQSTQQTLGNPVSGALGGGLLGSAIYNQFGGGASAAPVQQPFFQQPNFWGSNSLGFASGPGVNG